MNYIRNVKAASFDLLSSVFNLSRSISRDLVNYRPYALPNPVYLYFTQYIMSSLADFAVLSFDVYGTLINWEAGILEAFQSGQNSNIPSAQVLAVYHDLEKEQQTKTPDMPYSKLLSTIYPHLCERLGMSTPTSEECQRFGDSVGNWPAFPDTISALKRLSKHYKLVVLSNVDRESFAKSNVGSLEGFPFDLVITAQDVGSYKPDSRNFTYMIGAVRDKFAIEPVKILQTAQSQFHDHHPAKKAGLKSAWIERPGATMGNLEDHIYDWKFSTLERMANARENL